MRFLWCSKSNLAYQSNLGITQNRGVPRCNNILHWPVKETTGTVHCYTKQYSVGEFSQIVGMHDQQWSLPFNRCQRHKKSSNNNDFSVKHTHSLITIATKAMMECFCMSQCVYVAYEQRCDKGAHGELLLLHGVHR